MTNLSCSITRTISKMSDMKNDSKVLGSVGEDRAVAYLIRHGFVIISRNEHQRWGEIDIIATRRDTWHFIEVKTRSSTRHGQPYEAVTPWKIQHLKKAAYRYMLSNKLSLKTPMCMDVISILNGTGMRPHIKMYENISVEG